VAEFEFGSRCQSPKIAIVPQHVALSFRSFGEIFGYVFSRELCSFRAVAPVFPVSGDADTFE
jgi:hypothetical protein